MIHLDLFSGIGGFALALRQIGIEPRVQLRSEIEPFADNVYATRFPDSRNLGGITKINPVALCNRFPGDWLITGGFPCQDISLAGQNAKGFYGDRSSLWWHYWRIIRDIRPRWVLAENVSAICHAELYAVLKSLAAIGYDAEWYTVQADWYGAPHQRKRVFIAAHPNKFGNDDATKLENSTQRNAVIENMGVNIMPITTSRGFEFWSETLRACTTGAISFAPGICRMDDGVSAPIHRCAALGNAIVPFNAAFILQQLLRL